ncbi:probable low affinity copper uptake protein 2 isoform X2 [Oxyura jamaicensis]|uniref:probable low affinity copper uptake protein 2 isoform X2 n=1 Tax=Oxyura jamaicensis TaxID=8884 RepID=UPI0015A57636|nr:probable low affinity copper uptake protein 2 isoform X2 [Oxyura jamaicensis]
MGGTDLGQGSQLLGPREIHQGQEENPAQVFVAKGQELAAVPSAPGGFSGEEPRAKAFSSCFGAMKLLFRLSPITGSSGLGMPAPGGFTACFEPSPQSSGGPGWVLGGSWAVPGSQSHSSLRVMPALAGAGKKIPWEVQESEGFLGWAAATSQFRFRLQTAPTAAVCLPLLKPRQLVRVAGALGRRLSTTRVSSGLLSPAQTGAAGKKLLCKKAEMTFFFSDRVVLLFDFWSVHTPTGLALSVLVVALLSVLYEVVKMGKARVLQRALLAVPPSLSHEALLELDEGDGDHRATQGSAGGSSSMWPSRCCTWCRWCWATR